MSLASHPQSGVISTLSAKIAALYNIQLCRLAIFTAGPDLKLLWDDPLCNMMKYPGIIKTNTNLKVTPYTTRESFCMISD